MFRVVGPRVCSGGVLDPDPSGAMISYPPSTILDKSAYHGAMHYGTFELSSQFLGMLVVMLAVAKVGGFLVQKLGQPAVLGELIGGVLVGRSWLGLVNPEYETIHLLSELGVVILLFAIGLETDLGQLIKVGATSLTVAVVGVALAVCAGVRRLPAPGVLDLVSIMAGATLTATSVGITARVLVRPGPAARPGRSDHPGRRRDRRHPRPHDPDGRGRTDRRARKSRSLGIVKTTASAVRLSGGDDRGRQDGRCRCCFAGPAGSSCRARPTAMALITAFGLAWLAEQCGSAMIIGAFAAGLLVVSAPQAHEIERGITEIGHFFVPLFFVAVGASVDLSALDPFQPASRFALVTGGVLIVVGVAGKLAAGYAPFWFRGNKTVIGVGMVPRGEVGLIFAQMGLASGVFDAGLFGARHAHGDRHHPGGPAVPQAAPGAGARSARPSTSSKASTTSSPKPESRRTTAHRPRLGPAEYSYDRHL